MNNKKLLVLIVLSVLAVLSIAHGLVKSSGGKNPGAVVMEEVTASSSKPSSKSAYPAWGRNPFALSNERGASLEDLRLEGILSDKENFTAVINDKVVGIGEIIEGNTVVAIKADKVILNDGQKDFELKLNQ